MLAIRDGLVFRSVSRISVKVRVRNSSSYQILGDGTIDIQCISVLGTLRA